MKILRLQQEIGSLVEYHRISLFDSYFLGTCDWTNPSIKSCKTIRCSMMLLVHVFKLPSNESWTNGLNGLSWTHLFSCQVSLEDIGFGSIPGSSCSSKSRRSFNSSAVAFRRRSSCEEAQVSSSGLARLIVKLRNCHPQVSPTWSWWRGQTL